MFFPIENTHFRRKKFWGAPGTILQILGSALKLPWTPLTLTVHIMLWTNGLIEWLIDWLTYRPVVASSSASASPCQSVQRTDRHQQRVPWGPRLRCPHSATPSCSMTTADQSPVIIIIIMIITIIIIVSWCGVIAASSAKSNSRDKNYDK